MVPQTQPLVQNRGRCGQNCTCATGIEERSQGTCKRKPKVETPKLKGVFPRLEMGK